MRMEAPVNKPTYACTCTTVNIYNCHTQVVAELEKTKKTNDNNHRNSNDITAINHNKHHKNNRGYLIQTKKAEPDSGSQGSAIPSRCSAGSATLLDGAPLTPDLPCILPAPTPPYSHAPPMPLPSPVHVLALEPYAACPLVWAT